MQLRKRTKSKNAKLRPTFNQMVSVSENGSTTRYQYDVLGRRIEKSAGTDTTKYFYSGNQVIEERDNADLVTKQFVFGNGIDEVLRLDNYNADGTAIENSYFYHTNGIGSTTAITDVNGNIIERYSYGLYGLPVIKNSSDQVIASSTIDNEYMFQGRRFEKESGLYYYRARHFDPILGRFLQIDLSLAKINIEEKLYKKRVFQKDIICFFNK